MPLVLRQQKGTLLTIQEMDGNLTYLEGLALEKPAYINYFDFSSNLVTNIVAQDTWYKLNTNTTSSFSRNGLVHTNNRITNTGHTKVFQAEGIISMQAGNNQEIHVSFFKNGVLFPCSEQSVNTGLGNRVTAIPYHCLIELEENDYIETYVKNATGTTNITLDNINVIIKEM